MTPKRLEQIKQFIIDLQPWSAEKIREEVKKRGITPEELKAFDEWFKKEFSYTKFCPQCGYSYSYARFCESCGHLLPLPKTIEKLEERENVVENDLGHEDLKNSGCKFCPKCGRRL